MSLPRRIIVKIPNGLATAVLVILLIGMGKELDAHFGEMLQAGGLPKSYLMASVLAAGCATIAFVWLWYPHLLRPLIGIRKVPAALRWAVAAVLAAGFSWLLAYTKWSDVFNGVYTRIFFFLMIGGVSAWLVNIRSENENGDLVSWLAGFLVVGTVFQLFLSFQDVTGFPLSQGWSEGNRIYDYSVLFGRNRYIWPVGKPLGAFIDIGRQSLWGAIFLIPGVNIWGVRLWSALMWTVPYAILGWVLFTGNRPQQAGRPETNRWGIWLAFGVWAFLFLNQGPIYTSLIVAALFVAASRRTPLSVAMILVALGGYFANVSRYTWTFAPAMWGGLIALIEVSPYGVRTTFERWRRAILIGLGGLAGGYLIPVVIQPWLTQLVTGVKAQASVVSAEGLTNAVNRQPLLWNRLLPNETFGLGIVPALLLATLPLILLLAIFLFSGQWKLNTLQKLAIGGELAAFLAVGLVASVKIGGGSNLHNLDMFMICLLFVTGLAWEVGFGDWLIRTGQRSWPVAFVVLAAVAYPASNGLQTAANQAKPNPVRVSDAIDQIQKYADAAKTQGEVLFIDQRQLLTFGDIKDVPLVSDYEKKLMMDEAMAEDMNYFNPFYQDLAKHRFSMIVVEPLWVNFQGESYQFGNENDAWVKFVSVPVLCYYKPAETNLDVQVQILLPKEKSVPDGADACPQY
jgi:hypothetical protein